MNRPPEEFIRVDEERLLDFSTDCFEKAGISHEHAALISRLLVNSDLRGVRSHGTRTLSGYCGGFENGSLNPNPNITVINETPTSVVLDGNGTLGYLPMVRATEQAITKAKDVGIGMGLVRYIGHYGSAGHYARICNEAGCIGFSVQGYQNHGNAGNSDTKPQLGYYGNPPICLRSLLVMNLQLCLTQQHVSWLIINVEKNLMNYCQRSLQPSLKVSATLLLRVYLAVH
jgi:hypothetical protein